MEIINQLFSHVDSLHHFLLKTAKVIGSSQELEDRLLRDGDSDSYRSLLHDVMVGSTDSVGAGVPVSVDYTPLTKLSEVGINVIQKLVKKKCEKNVFSFGHYELSHNSAAQISSCLRSEYAYPNHTNALLHCRAWKTLHSRIGDQLMMYLLERQSMFVPVGQDSYIQITGVPVYDMISRIEGTCSQLNPTCHYGGKDITGMVSNMGKRKRTMDGKQQKKALHPSCEQPDSQGIDGMMDDIPCKRPKIIVDSQKVQHYSHHKQLPRKNMFYARNLREKLPNSFHPTCVDDLVEEVFLKIDVTTAASVSMATVSHDKCSEKDVREATLGVTVTSAVKPLLFCLLENLRKKSIIYSLLNYHCKAPQLKTCRPRARRLPSRGESSQSAADKVVRRGKMGGPTVAQLLETHSRHRQVYLFLRSLLKRIVPLQLFGSPYNRRVFLKNVRKFVGLGRYETLQLGEIMRKMKVSHCKWLKSVKNPVVRENLVAMVLWWIMTRVVMVTLKSYFYITETGPYRYHTFYFRKRLWMTLRAKGVSDFLKLGTLAPMSEKEAMEMMHAGISLGCSQLRLLPKLSSLRPIVSMGLGIGTQALSVKQQLSNVLHVLSYIKNMNPGLVGSSVFGLDDIYAQWRNFVLKRRAAEDTGPLYFVKADIEKCFDTILPEKLYSVVENALNSVKASEFIIRRYAVVLNMRGRLRKQFRKSVHTLTDFEPDFQKFTKSSLKHLRNAVIVDQVMYRHENKESLLSLIKTHLFHNIIKVGRRYYHQFRGISQGSVLSSMLCNLYYAAMERDVFAVSEGELLMRHVDDFLFVTPHLENARAFLKRLSDGIKEFNCFINKSKTLASFESDDIIPVCSAALFPWCGLCLHMATLEVMVDYSRYNGLNLRDTMTMECGVRALRETLAFSLKQRCHGIFLDIQLNSLPTVLLSTYKMFLMTARRFHCFMKKFPTGRKANENPAFFLGLIQELIHLFFCYGKHRVWDKHKDPGTRIKEDLTEWLGLRAFLQVLRKHQGGYFKLLKLLKTRFSRCERKMKLTTSTTYQNLTEITSQGEPREFDDIML
ncbi:telomerase reverse transcriptase [Lingula anatina]|uniref:Telomerase reverse transcriptase n=1 Tax=Lingula anatina TaxID=7574 RepID=A0A1S3H3M9_LINAN|nr:telomerase reverse transcriptase [Lingula anatina]|eukprot:XP_013380608.1 telomerase reverse transcriptase [Lingula anatina]